MKSENFSVERVIVFGIALITCLMGAFMISTYKNDRKNAIDSLESLQKYVVITNIEDKDAEQLEYGETNHRYYFAAKDYSTGEIITLSFAKANTVLYLEELETNPYIIYEAENREFELHLPGNAKTIRYKETEINSTSRGYVSSENLKKLISAIEIIGLH